MRIRIIILNALPIFLSVLIFACHSPVVKPHSWLHLADGSTGREIALEPLWEGEEVVYTWRNSMFRLMVTEILVLRDGRLVLTEVTYADPRGFEPPLSKVEDLDNLFQTGGPFRVTGISRPFTRLIFRVGEIGKPKLKIGEKVVELEREVGFGGTVVLTVKTMKGS